MASKYWIKLYHEMIDDPKVARLPDSSHRRFVECLLLAGETDEGGYLPPIEDMAWRLRQDETSLSADMSRLANSQLVEIKEDGRWFVTSFAKRQAPSDAARRMKEMRKRKRLEEKETEAEEIRKDTDTDIDTYRSVTSDVTGVTNRNDAIYEFITSLSSVSKTPHWVKTESDYEDAAYYLHGKDATQEQIELFGDWWKLNGYYVDKPALKTIVDEWDKYMSFEVKKTKTVRENGSLQL